jgi:hypothetical protein
VKFKKGFFFFNENYLTSLIGGFLKMEIIYLQVMLIVVSSVLILFLNMVGVSAYHGIKIFLLIQGHRNKKKDKKPPRE